MADNKWSGDGPRKFLSSSNHSQFWGPAFRVRFQRGGKIFLWISVDVKEAVPEPRWLVPFYYEAEKWLSRGRFIKILPINTNKTGVVVVSTNLIGDWVSNKICPFTQPTRVKNYYVIGSRDDNDVIHRRSWLPDVKHTSREPIPSDFARRQRSHNYIFSCRNLHEYKVITRYAEPTVTISNGKN